MTAIRCEALPAFEAVVFDMDGLLLDSETLALAATRDAAREQGVELPDSLLHQLIGMPADTCRELIAAHGGPALALDAMFAAAAEHLQAAVTAGRLHVKAGAMALLDELDRLGLPRGVATSSGHGRAHHHLEVSGLLARMKVVVTRDEVPRGKPHPDLYLHAAERLGVAPHRCLAFEDSYNGVRAAAAAGMPVVMVPDLLPATDEMRALAVMVIGSLRELLPCLAERTPPARG